MTHRPSDTAPAIACSDLSIGRRDGRRGPVVRVVDGVTLEVPRGRSLALMGPTGGGKSSLASLLAGVEDAGVRIVGGAAAVAGIPLARPRDRRAVAFITGHLGQGDGAALPARLPVFDIVAAPVTTRTRTFNADALAHRVGALLDELQLPFDIAARFPHELSAGMRQRVALARALVLDPRVLVADELFANLDVDARAAVRGAVVRRRAEYGMATLVVTNEAEVARELDADILVIESGHAVAYARSGEDLLWTPNAGGRRLDLGDASSGTG